MNINKIYSGLLWRFRDFRLKFQLRHHGIVEQARDEFNSLRR